MASTLRNCTLVIALCSAAIFPGSGPVRADHATVRNYRPFTTELYTKDKKLARIALRRFIGKGKEYYLAVNPDTLESELAPVGKYLFLKRSLGEMREEHGNRAYFKALAFSERNSRNLQNAGITHISGHGAAVYLTADLCPTRRPLDRALFMRIMNEYGNYHKPVPVALSITGRWMEKHSADLRWLIDLEKNKIISIVWINHTYTHLYKKNLPLSKNFLLNKTAGIDEEILHNEIAMIESGLIPSVFFRFPGLISNREAFLKITGLGLIPVGSDAWLGKNQWPKQGSIILVHANNQELVGMKRLAGLINAKQKAIAAGEWMLRDIRAGIVEYMKMY
ncbi:MAG: hypothetical protein A2W19_06765 [Spirochaetes bacterium RBG_16_49_21]|nr:MAG: hypothetical protein A2W19_06765 [Spirochaetes bacterium RBG_16_49_21]